MESVRASEAEHCCYPRCTRDIYSSGSPPFCGKHLIRCAVFIADYMNLDLIIPGHREAQAQLRRETRERYRKSQVYYVRLGNHIKIGTTVHLKARLATLGAGYPEGEMELLGVEPGAQDVEYKRHQQFAAERVSRRRELFNPSRRLLAHIEKLAG